VRGHDVGGVAATGAQAALRLGFLERAAACHDAEVTVDQDSTARVMQAYGAASKNTLADRMGITIVEASAERVVGTMPVAGNTQPYGLLHGGASCVLAETLGSLGSALFAGPDRITLGIDISATHHRSASAGEVTGVATLLYGGRTVTTYEIVISDGAGRRICTSRLTCLLTQPRTRSGPAADSAPAGPGTPA
jgi:1,4-dihydroxy-2-naphthoyl-CoA hydrolase